MTGHGVLGPVRRGVGTSEGCHAQDKMEPVNRGLAVPGYHGGNLKIMLLKTIPLAALLLAALPALAQNSQSVSPTNPTVPVAPPNAGSTLPPDRIAPSGGNLAARPPERQGAITPPNVDPGMTVSPPRNGLGMMPVIPPPGTPGGDRSVVPK